MNLKQRLVAGSLAAFLVVSLVAPLVSQATNVAEPNYGVMSIAQLEQLIGKLQARLAEMKKGSACFVSDKDLSVGDGEDDGLTADINRLQSFLKEKGFFAYKPTGYFGKATRASLVAFQKAQGIAATGEFDAATRAKAHALTCTVAKKSVMKDDRKEAEKKEAEKKVENTGLVSSLSLGADGDHVKWTTYGYSKQGFKVVWSKAANPTYPLREGDRYQYFTDPGENESERLEAFDGAGTYYVRVCEYLGGRCGAYSNNVTVSLQ